MSRNFRSMTTSQLLNTSCDISEVHDFGKETDRRLRKHFINARKYQRRYERKKAKMKQ